MPSRSPDLFVNAESLSEASKARLLVAITFHFVPLRLSYLGKVLSSLARFPLQTRRIVIFTNTVVASEQEEILQTVRLAALIPGQDVDLEVVPHLAYPYWLTWAHKTLIAKAFGAADSPYSHFAYLEDDEELTFEGFAYFVAARELLRPFRMIPSYVRVEWSASRACYVNTDHGAQINLAIRPSISNGQYAFVEMDNPYSGAFLLDQELALEYIVSRSFDRERSCQLTSWHLRERAAMGLTFETPPTPFLYRSVVPVSVATHTVPSCAWLAHLPNNHADNPGTYFGKIPIENLFLYDFNAAEVIRKSANENQGYRFHALAASSLEDVRRLCLRSHIAGMLRARTLYRRFFPTKDMLYGAVSSSPLY